MKTVLKVISLMMLCGALFVGCGSGNNNNSSCSTNGVNGTMVNGVCSLSTGVSGQCSTPPYSYYIASVQDTQPGTQYYGQTIPACCTQPQLVQGISCVPAVNGGVGGNGYGCPRGVNPYTGQCY